jgi:hypothetical protein
MLFHSQGNWKILNPNDPPAPPQWIQPRDITTNSPIGTAQAVTSKIQPFATMNQPALVRAPHLGKQPQSTAASTSRIQSPPPQTLHSIMSLAEAQSSVKAAQDRVRVTQVELDEARRMETNTKEGLRRARRAKNNVKEAQRLVARAMNEVDCSVGELIDIQRIEAEAQYQLQRVQAIHQAQHHGAQQHTSFQSQFVVAALPSAHTQYGDAKAPGIPRQFVRSALPSTNPRYDDARYAKIQPKIAPALQVDHPSYLLTKVPNLVGTIALQRLGCDKGCLAKRVGWWIGKIDPRYTYIGRDLVCERCAIPIIVLDREVPTWCNRVTAARTLLCGGKPTAGIAKELLKAHYTDLKKAAQDLKHRFKLTLIEDNHEFDYQNFEYRRSMSFEMEVICGAWELECLGMDFQFFNAIDLGQLDRARRIAEDVQDADYQYLRRVLEKWADVTREHLMVRVQEKDGKS